MTGEPALQNSQLAFATRDIHAAMAHFSRHLRIGPWFVLPQARLPCRHRGVEGRAELIVAFSNTQGLEIEMIQQMNDAPSIWQGFLDGRPERERFHHSCIRTVTFEATMATMQQDGYLPVVDGETSRGRFAYIEHPDSPDAYVEVLENSPSRQAMHAHVLAAARTWDGGDPIRPMPQI